MNIKKVLLSILFLVLFISFSTSQSVLAADSSQKSILDNSIFLKIKESVQYFFTFGADKKVAVLEKQAENSLDMAQDYADNGDQTEVQNSVQNYLQKKEKQDNLLGKIDENGTLGAVQERTIDQQKTMEEIKMKVDGEVKNEIIQVQEQVVNQVAQRVIVTNGPEGQTEFFNKVEHVWAPGTGPGGGESGVVVEGGTMQFAPGTSAGSGNATNDIKTVEVKGN
jgi:hypothetical protein